MRKNIVVCCDGTGNEISENISNVLKLYRTMRKTGKTEPEQRVFYDPGVGTLARPNPWTKFKQDAATVFGLATGYGLDENVLAAYRFLIDNYSDGDDIYLFGFSRGAYTVRVLAALIHKIGLLSPQQSNLADQALAAYKQTPLSAEKASIEAVQSGAARSEADQAFLADDGAAQFARIVSPRWPTIRFMGVWDTVASVIVPGSGVVPSFRLEELAFTLRNPSLRVFRHALSIDERRRMFRRLPWLDEQTFMHNRFSSSARNFEPQDSKQVWFAGVHADIGGGYPERESGVSKYPLIWMIEEAVAHGLTVDRRTVNHLAWGVARKGSPYTYVAPDCTADIHHSLSRRWAVIEPFPKADKYKEWLQRKSRFGYYVPNGEPRSIPENALIHESVIQRMNAGRGYAPINIPKAYTVEPWDTAQVEDGSNTQLED
jgi:uncharacterized protein (DUF2235 family)